MAFAPPTPATLKTRFPRFDSVDNAVIQGALDEAARLVDGAWPEEDRALGLMLYAAHVLTLDGQGGGTEAQLNAEGVGDFQSIKLGSLSLSRFAKSDAQGAQQNPALAILGETTFGRRFLALAGRFAGGPVSTGEASGLTAGSPYARDVSHLPGLGSAWPGNG